MESEGFSNRNKRLGEFLAQINEMLAGRKQELRQGAYDSLADKKNRFLLDDAVCMEQLEKNVVYSAEGTMDIIKAMRVYIDENYEKMRESEMDEIVRFVQSIPVIEAKDRSAYHVRYLVEGCSGCDYHEQHQEYRQLKVLRDDTGNPEKYREELEFNYVYHQVQNRLAKHYLLTFIQNDQEVAGIINEDEDLEQIKMNLHLITNYILDNISFDEGGGIEELEDDEPKF